MVYRTQDLYQGTRRYRYLLGIRSDFQYLQDSSVLSRTYLPLGCPGQSDWEPQHHQGTSIQHSSFDIHPYHQDTYHHHKLDKPHQL